MKSASGALPIKRTEIVVPFRRINDRREELAFLPAALEIVETPPSPIGRAIVATIVVLFCVALVWSWWGTIDIVASATGNILEMGGILDFSSWYAGMAVVPYVLVLVLALYGFRTSLGGRAVWNVE